MLLENQRGINDTRIGDIDYNNAVAAITAASNNKPHIQPQGTQEYLYSRHGIHIKNDFIVSPGRLLTVLSSNNSSLGFAWYSCMLNGDALANPYKGEKIALAFVAKLSGVLSVKNFWIAPLDTPEGTVYRYLDLSGPSAVIKAANPYDLYGVLCQTGNVIGTIYLKN